MGPAANRPEWRRSPGKAITFESDRFTVRPFEAGDEERILALHNQEFAGHPERSREQWLWRFRDNPLGRTEVVLALDADGSCAATYAGITLPILLDGAECRAGVHVDMAVDRRFRDGLGGTQLAVAVGARYFDAFAGGETRLTWGFPEPGLQRIGLRFLKFQILRDVMLLVRPAAQPVRMSAAGVSLVAVDRLGPDVDDLWSHLSAEIGTGTIRNRAYLNWRYADQPGISHLFLEARDDESGALRGVTVLRDGGIQEDIVSLMDWLVPRDDRDTEAALVRGVVEETRRRGRPYIVCWFAGARDQFYRFQTEYGFHVHETPYQECFRSWVNAAQRRWLHEHWYQTMGDIDFF